MTEKDLCESYGTHYQENKERLEEMIVEASGLSELFKALADETRTKILYLLSAGELCVCDLSELLSMSLPAISHHLRLLKLLRLVSYRRDGRQVFYTLADQHVAELIKVAREHFAEGLEQG